MPPMIKELSEKSVVPIQLTLLVALVVGVWTLANRVAAWERDLADLKRALDDRWTLQMERAAWREWSVRNGLAPGQAPDVEEIRRMFGGG